MKAIEKSRQRHGGLDSSQEIEGKQGEDKIIKYKGLHLQLKEMRQMQRDYQSYCYKLFTQTKHKYLKELFEQLIQRELSTFKKNLLAQHYRRSELKIGVG